MAEASVLCSLRLHNKRYSTEIFCRHFIYFACKVNKFFKSMQISDSFVGVNFYLPVILFSLATPLSTVSLFPRL